jgi:membrane protein
VVLLSAITVVETLASSLRQMTRLARGFELLSLALVVWGSSGIFMPVERVLNIVWGARAERSFWKSRLLAFLLTAAGAALALVSVALTLFGRSLGRMPSLDPQLAGPLALLGGWAAKATATLLSWTLFTLVYRVAPSAGIRFGVAWRAGLWAALAWEASKYAFVWNLGRMQLDVLQPAAFAVALCCGPTCQASCRVRGRRRGGAHGATARRSPSARAGRAAGGGRA